MKNETRCGECGELISECICEPLTEEEINELYETKVIEGED
jgi:hypothetical protein